MLISTAYAQGTGLLDQSALIQFLPLVLIFIVFYFLSIRPQQKKAKDQRSMLDALRRGDRVVTGGEAARLCHIGTATNRSIRNKAI